MTKLELIFTLLYTILISISIGYFGFVFLITNDYHFLNWQPFCQVGAGIVSYLCWCIFLSISVNQNSKQ
jgi:hypothetical protein